MKLPEEDFIKESETLSLSLSLKDHDVPEDNILFVSILAAQLGVHSVAYAFPKVKIVTSAIDAYVDQNYHILPGVGNYGDRYFGTGLD